LSFLITSKFLLMYNTLSFINTLLKKNSKKTSRAILHKFYKAFIKGFFKKTNFHMFIILFF
jgi:hypothetical protein